MKRPGRLHVLGIALLLCSVPAMAGSDREWHKRTGTSEFDGTVLADWSYFVTSDDLSPVLTRRFLKLGDDHHLVVRSSTDLVSQVETITIDHLESGASVVFEMMDWQLVVTLGTRQFIVSESEVPENATSLSPTLMAEGREFLEHLPQGFRDALSRLRAVGCHQTRDLWVEAFLTAVYYDPNCRIPSGKATNVSYTSRFDVTTPPSPLEAEFGSAYTFED